ncbi:hypothetical protein [Thermoflavifilum thermophilum]|uniref:Terpene synthase n=1 Tax=Thermoflavifilum thermophilum TaxID=1393122 RepID=A0A1I7NGK0_9BACT|nr:hypothetical protein [Thermoflavifilum thermophilum]SFV33794.1 hypothetical protein SAMN05660895_1815 [Thermoflavifilum thermophilum]
MTVILHIRFLTRLLIKAWDIIRKRKTETLRARKCLWHIEQEKAQKFPPEIFEKIAVSYGIYESVVVEGFCRLRGRKASAAEKKRFVYYFICSSLFDYFVDDMRMPFERIAMLSFKPEEETSTTFEEEVFLDAHRWLRKQVNDTQGYEICSHALFTAQKESLLQFDKDLPPSTVLDITFRKGGYAVQLSSYYLDDKVPEIERKIWYQLGVLIQLTNDLYDVWKDASQQIRSSVLAVQDMHQFVRIFHQQVETLWELIKQHPARKSAKQNFLLHIAGTLSFGYIAMDQLTRLQGDQNYLPAYDSAHRKDWIIDMEKVENLKLWLKTTRKLYYQGLQKVNYH